MAKPKTLREQANHAAEKAWPTLHERDGIRRKSVDLWLAGHRAGSRITKAERAVIEAAVKWQSSRGETTYIRLRLLTDLGALVVGLKNAKKVRK